MGGEHKALTPPGWRLCPPVQGLEWYTANKKQDKHGDIADEFLEEQANAPIVQKQPVRGWAGVGRSEVACLRMGG